MFKNLWLSFKGKLRQTVNENTDLLLIKKQKEKEAWNLMSPKEREAVVIKKL